MHRWSDVFSDEGGLEVQEVRQCELGESQDMQSLWNAEGEGPGRAQRRWWWIQ